MTSIPCYKLSMDKDSLKLQDRPMDYSTKNTDTVSHYK